MHFIARPLVASVARRAITLSARDAAAQPSARFLATAATGATTFTTVQVPMGKESVTLHSIWLRDHCRCPACWHPVTKQRLVETQTIPKDLAATDVKQTDAQVQITWKDGHVSTFDKAWLKDHAYGKTAQFKDLEETYEPALWGSEIAQNPPSVPYDEVMDPSNAGLRKWLENIAIHGFSFVKGVPASVEKSKELVARITFIRESHYGGYWDFTPNLEHGDTAYTSLALPAHTDTTYFTDPVGLQMFHLLEHRGTGGESLLVDGFKVAAELRRLHPDAYVTLSTTKVAAHCAGDADTYIYPKPRYHALLNHDERGKLVQIRYNNNDRSVLNHLSFDQVAAYYDALQKWQAIAHERKDLEYWFPLGPGTVVIFDNWRVMHARAAFTGYRRLTGCYVNGDDWRSRLRTVAGVNRKMC
ncbi:trimethyllysine dioxygenase [Allomyces macrogynus ATCC 38327]|uniref:trimethyllysine dioxygenase n=1 Tax=Allomyces macrogynus (strain ATCC 38327) TaxID=578462 RepID=A0A0L0SDG0_ALLM3|nr:trimethyllysine dioxygenase [Allomyces macrogynus ATCC 38327]|eukprot:KNE60445.1 trimethyllysine dioxygenase [Allomyces macrogynus ATCC 38327]